MLWLPVWHHFLLSQYHPLFGNYPPSWHVFGWDCHASSSGVSPVTFELCRTASPHAVSGSGGGPWPRSGCLDTGVCWGLLRNCLRRRLLGDSVVCGVSRLTLLQLISLTRRNQPAGSAGKARGILTWSLGAVWNLDQLGTGVRLFLDFSLTRANKFFLFKPVLVGFLFSYSQPNVCCVNVWVGGSLYGRFSILMTITWNAITLK